MGVKLVSASAGSVEIVAPTTASNYTATLPAGTGSLVVNGVNSSIVSGSATASTSGVAVDFTTIPSWAKRVTLSLSLVSTGAGTSPLLVQIGPSASITTTGYSCQVSSRITTYTSTTGFILEGVKGGSSTDTGLVTLVLENPSTNIWVESSVITDPANINNPAFGGGRIALSGALSRIRLTTVGGTDTFSSGEINILYE